MSENFVKFPSHLVQTTYDGYLYHPAERTLYSFKSGKLKPIKQLGAYAAQKRHGEDGWRVSVAGTKKFLSKNELRGLFPVNYQVPFA